MSKSIFCIVAVSAVIVLMKPAYAYLDPGAASMILQALLGGIAGLAVLCTLYWRKFLGFLKRYQRSEPKDDNTQANQAD